MDLFKVDKMIQKFIYSGHFWCKPSLSAQTKPLSSVGITALAGYLGMKVNQEKDSKALTVEVGSDYLEHS